MLFQIKNGVKFFGTTEIFKNCNFEVNENEKIAIIGRNGTGKTTLLKMIYGEEFLESGDIYANPKLNVGYLSQVTLDDQEQTVQEALLTVFNPLLKLEARMKQLEQQIANNHDEKMLEEYSRVLSQYEIQGGYQYLVDLKTVFTKFGFQETDLAKSIKAFSGGERTKIAFVKLLLEKPDILLLDEPTNHLDLDTINWLETYLKNYPKAIVLVSHDRKFINEVVSTIYEVEYYQLTKYRGNYDTYLQLKQTNRQSLQIAYKAQQEEIAKIQEFIDRNRYQATKASLVQSRIKQLEKMERIEPPKESQSHIKFNFKPKLKGGKKVIVFDNFSFGFDYPFGTINLEVFSGQRIGIIGENGSGKSTFLKTIMNELPRLDGDVLLGHQIEIGYFDQKLAHLSSDKLVIDELWDAYPEYDRTQIRTLLANFLFTNDDVFKSLSVLSGGEKVRIALLKLMLQGANLLLLDEPTNHLDLDAKERLEAALLSYPATILFVSHDRYFIEKIATSLLVFKDNKVTYFPYGYQQWLQQNNQRDDVKSHEKKSKQSSYKGKKMSLGKLEKEITECERIIAEYDQLQYEESYYQNQEKMEELLRNREEYQEKLEDLLKQWENQQL